MMSDAAGQEFEQALRELDFAAAREIAERCDPGARAEMRERIKSARAEAGQRAGQLAGRIQSLARADHYEGLLALAADPDTGRLLNLLAPELRRGAKVHLDGARRRQERSQQAARRHIDAASAALSGLDPARAAQELARVERRWLNEDQREELDRLGRQISEARAEQRELTEITSEVLREHQPPPVAEDPPEPEPRPRKRLGCLGSLLVALPPVAAAALLMITTINLF